MSKLYEYSDIKDHRYECFVEDHNSPYEVRMHWHYFMEIMYIAEGRIKVTIGRNDITALPGDLVVLLPSAMHAIKTLKEPARYSVIKFTPGNSAMGGLSWSESALLTLSSQKDIKVHFRSGEIQKTRIPELTENAINEMKQKHMGYLGIISADLQIVLTEIIRLWAEEGMDTSLLSSSEESYIDIGMLPSYIDENISRPLLASDMASMCNMSYSRFARKFKKIFGRPFKEYVQYVRVAKACELLKTTGMDLAMISAMTGFTDASHLIRVFRKEMGLTPNKYRNS